MERFEVQRYDEDIDEWVEEFSHENFFDIYEEFLSVKNNNPDEEYRMLEIKQIY